ncbi:MAG: hypothetical protein GF308_18440 [Candidatus Heimdallarchaeota archaeon]|nr:hypothetical protein [Candidatus Heimdallarchaeota archaeon]
MAIEWHKKELVAKLRAISEQLVEKYPISFVILFGSYAKGKVNNLSDIDLGVFLNRDSKIAYFDSLLTLKTLFEEQLKTEQIDLVIINNAPPVLKFEIVAKGILIYCKDRNEFDNQYLQACSEYFDFKFILNRNYQYVRDKIRESASNE